MFKFVCKMNFNWTTKLKLDWKTEYNTHMSLDTAILYDTSLNLFKPFEIILTFARLGWYNYSPDKC